MMNFIALLNSIAFVACTIDATWLWCNGDHGLASTMTVLAMGNFIFVVKWVIDTQRKRKQ